MNARQALALAISAATLVGGATTLALASTRSTAGCNSAIEYCDPGQLHAGVYTTRYFLQRMRVTVPGSGWVSHRDSTTEFKLSPPGSDPNAPSVIRFWIDPRVSTRCTDKVLPLKLTTPASVVRWMRTNKNFVVAGTGRFRAPESVKPALSSGATRRGG